MASAYQAKVSGVQAKGTATAARKKVKDYAQKITNYASKENAELKKLNFEGSFLNNLNKKAMTKVATRANTNLATANKIQKTNIAMAIDADKTSTRANDYAAIVARKEAGVKKNSKTVNKVYRPIGK